MIKEGDKVVCIKNFSISGQRYYKGKSYEISSISDDRGVYKVYIKGENTNNIGSGYWFYINYNKNNDFNIYFATMAKWRETQIDSILDD